MGEREEYLRDKRNKGTEKKVEMRNDAWKWNRGQNWNSIK